MLRHDQITGFRWPSSTVCSLRYQGFQQTYIFTEHPFAPHHKMSLLGWALQLVCFLRAPCQGVNVTPGLPWMVPIIPFIQLSVVMPVWGSSTTPVTLSRFPIRMRNFTVLSILGERSVLPRWY